MDRLTSRHIVGGHLQRWGCSNIDQAVLVLSELVTNAVIYAGGADRILVVCNDSWIRIVVHDNGPGAAHLRQGHPTRWWARTSYRRTTGARMGLNSLGDGKAVSVILPHCTPRNPGRDTIDRPR